MQVTYTSGAFISGRDLREHKQGLVTAEDATAFTTICNEDEQKRTNLGI